MIHQQLTEQLGALQGLLRQLSMAQYSRKIVHLGNASIGGHTRHVIELIQCVTDAYDTGMIDYHNRLRNLELESNKELALQQLMTIDANVQRLDKPMQLRMGKSEIGMPAISTTFYRELVYHVEHVIHHLALIKVALHEQQLQITDEHFGMAYSTIQYRSQQVTPLQN